MALDLYPSISRAFWHMESSFSTTQDLTLESVKAELHSRNSLSLTPIDIEAHAGTVHRILELKKKHDLVILGHNYMEPLVFGISNPNEQGDSLALSMSAVQADSKSVSYTHLTLPTNREV